MLYAKYALSAVGLISFLFYNEILTELIALGCIGAAILILAHFMPKAQRRSGRMYVILKTIISLAIAACLTVGENVVHSGNFKASISDAYIEPLGYADIGIMAVLAFFIYNFITILSVYINRLIDFISENQRPVIRMLRKPIAIKHFALICFICLLVCWSICFITYYPGTAVHDTRSIISNPVGSSTQHTIFYNFFLYGSIKIVSDIFGNVNLGAACYSVLQMLFCVAAATYFLNWMAKRNVPAIIVIGTLLFFMFSRIIALMTIVTLKDVIFSFAVLIIIPIICDAEKTRGANFAKASSIAVLSCVSAITILIRNNGKFLIIPLMAVLLFLYRKHYKSIVLIILLGVVLPCSLDAYLMKTIVKSEKTAAESLAIPLQQIAAAVAYNGEISDEDMAIVNEIMPEENIRQYYTPLTVDGLKWHSDGTLNRAWLGDNMGEFLKLWARILPDNLGTYVEAYLLETLSYWKIGEPSSAQAVYYEYVELPENTFDIKNTRIFPERVQAWLEDHYRLSNTEIPSAASLIWLIAILALIQARRTSFSSLLSYLPILLIWVPLMLSCPHAFVFRYVYALYLAIPIYIAKLFTYDNNTLQV